MSTMSEHNAVTAPAQYHTLSAEIERRNLDKTIGFHLEVAQQPKQSRMCGVGEKNNRRPIDPPPAVKVVLKDSRGNYVTYPAMDTAFLFLQVVLVHESNRLPVVVPARERQMTALVGVTNTTMHRINVPVTDGPNPGTIDPWGVFAFTDLSVRQEGDYQLEFNLYEIISGEAVHRARTYSDTFHVYAAKGFPGMEQSTAFTDLLKKHGIRVRVSKSIRATKKFTAKQRNLMNHTARGYENDAMRDVTYDHHRRSSTKYDSYESSGIYNPPMTILPPPVIPALLPPPNNAQPMPSSPSVYDREHSHNRVDYGTHSSYYSQPASQYREYKNEYPRVQIPENTAMVYERRPDRPKTQDYYSGPNAYQQTASPYPSPYSPPPPNRGYSPASHIGTGSHPHNPTARHTNPSYSPRPSGRHQADYINARRRSSIVQSQLPPIAKMYDAEQYKHTQYSPMQDVRHVSHTERPNGMDYTGKQFQPPPTQPPQDHYYFSGYNGNEGYRGHGQ